MDSYGIPPKLRSSGLLETSCGYLLQELKLIWDEVGQDQLERDKVLLQLEQECLEVYRRKVDTASISRAHLHQKLADSEAEFTRLLVSLGERSLPGRPEKMVGTLKEQLDLITPALKEMQQRKEERMNQFREVQMQIQKISAEIAGQSELDISLTCVAVNEHDLSLKKLEEYRIDLQRLHKEKNDRLTKVEGYICAIRNLSATLGMDSYIVISEVHPSLDGSCGQQSKNISDGILTRLKITMDSLEEEKQKRIEKLHNLGEALINLWNLMETSYEDCLPFSHVAKFVSVAAADICSPRSLTLEIIQQAEAEVERLDRLKASKMKELFVKKQIELKEICRRTHIEIPSQSEMDSLMNLINSGEIGHVDLLTTMDEQISRANEEASSRKSIMEKVEKWMVSLDEEHWLEEYSRDDNRYSVKRGAHKNLKRAEHARITVNKIPALVDSLIAKTRSWEEERKNVFLYDKVPLLAMLEEYMLLREEKEEEMQRQRERKKVNVQLVVEQENLFRTRPSTSNYRIPNRSINGGVGSATPINRRLSMGIQQLSSNGSNSATQSISFIKRNKQAQDQKMLTPQPHVSHFRDDTASVVSATYSAPFSP